VTSTLGRQLIWIHEEPLPNKSPRHICKSVGLLFSSGFETLGVHFIYIMHMWNSSSKVI